MALKSTTSHIARNAGRTPPPRTTAKNQADEAGAAGSATSAGSRTTTEAGGTRATGATQATDKIKEAQIPGETDAMTAARLRSDEHATAFGEAFSRLPEADKKAIGERMDASLAKLKQDPNWEGLSDNAKGEHRRIAQAEAAAQWFENKWTPDERTGQIRPETLNWLGQQGDDPRLAVANAQNMAEHASGYVSNRKSYLTGGGPVDQKITYGAQPTSPTPVQGQQQSGVPSRTSIVADEGLWGQRAGTWGGAG